MAFFARDSKDCNSSLTISRTLSEYSVQGLPIFLALNELFIIIHLKSIYPVLIMVKKPSSLGLSRLTCQIPNYKSEISESELEVFEGINNDSDSILSYLNKFKTLDNELKQQIYNKQLLFKNKMADNQLEQELVRKDLLF